MAHPLPSSEQLLRDRGICKRIYFLAGLFMLLFSIIGLRLYHIQVKRHDFHLHQAKQRYQRTISLPAQRGSIFAHNEELLAYDEQTWELHTDSYHLRDADLIRQQMAHLENLSKAEIKAKYHSTDLIQRYQQHVIDTIAPKLDLPLDKVTALIRSPRPSNVLLTDIPDDKLEDLRNTLSTHHIKGIYLRPGTERRLACKDRLTLTIGAVKEKTTGIWGVEQYCNDLLRGTPGHRQIVIDSRNIEQPLYRGDTVPARNGSDVYLTIDMNLQNEIEAIIEQYTLQYAPRSIATVLVDPTTGSILAMACRPHLNLETQSGNWRNIPVSDAYEPGSVMKIVAIAGALEAGIYGPESPIDCGHGRYDSPELGTATIYDDSKRLGTQPLWGILAHSSNIGTYKVARKLGWENFEKTLRRFGFGSSTGLSICHEPQGYWPPLDTWTAVDFSRMSYGYGLTATLLQQAMAYCAIANGGVLLKPRLIDRIKKPDHTRPETVPPQIVHQAITARTAAQLRHMLTLTVEKGTAKRAAIPGVTVAGKTGTRKVLNPVTKKYYDDKYLVSFAGFAPAENPRVVCIVMVDNPTTVPPAEIRGGIIAAPIFSHLVKTTLDHLDVRLEHSPILTTASTTTLNPGGQP